MSLETWMHGKRLVEALLAAERRLADALAAPPVTEEMVERGARAMCASKGYPPDEIFHAQGETPMRMWQFFKEDARAVLAAAGGGK